MPWAIAESPAAMTPITIAIPSLTVVIRQAFVVGSRPAHLGMCRASQHNATHAFDEAAHGRLQPFCRQPRPSVVSDRIEPHGMVDT
jgi:hypothetical protein